MILQFESSALPAVNSPDRRYLSGPVKRLVVEVFPFESLFLLLVPKVFFQAIHY
jgi:hypothetical protein